MQNARNRLVSYENGDHREHNGAGESGQVTKLPRAKGEPWIPCMASRITIRERRKEQRPSVGTHVQPVRDQRDGPEQQAAGDLRDHHEATQPDHRPRFALAALMVGRQKDVTVIELRHGAPDRLLEVGVHHVHQLIGSACATAAPAIDISQMGAHMILHDFCHQA